MSEYRLVSDVMPMHAWGILTGYYTGLALQERRGGKWVTVPLVAFSELPKEEQAEIAAAQRTPSDARIAQTGIAG